MAFVPYGPWPCCTHCGSGRHKEGFVGHRLPCSEDPDCAMGMIRDALEAIP